MKLATSMMWVSGALALTACFGGPDETIEDTPEKTVKETSHRSNKSFEKSQNTVNPDEMLAKAVEEGAPGMNHERLNPLVGEFNATSTFWMSPDAPPMRSEGTMHAQWILGNRFILGQYRGDLKGMPFEGLNLMGFDKTRNQYTGTWADNMGTHLLPLGFGHSSPDGRTITMKRTMLNPSSNEMVHIREVTTIADNDNHTLEMWEVGSNGKEFRTLEVQYSRVK